MESADAGQVNVLVAHPEPLMAMGLARSLYERPGVRVFMQQGAAPDGPIDVVLTDYVRGLRMVAARDGAPPSRRPRVLIVANEAREGEVRLALECGVHGYMLCASDPRELVDGVWALKRGQRYVCSTAAQSIAEGMTREALSAREAEVLALMAEGCSNRVIGLRLELAPGTVKQHVRRVMIKLSASSRTHAVILALARGMIDRTHPPDELA